MPHEEYTEEHTFQISGDPAYGVGPHILSPFSGMGQRTLEEHEWNAEMSAVHIKVGHGFGIVANTWPFLNAAWKMQVYSSPVGRYYWVCVLLTNCQNCLHPNHSNQVAQYYECVPPDLNTYIISSIQVRKRDGGYRHNKVNDIYLL